jgi:hypothetical protein
MTEHIEWNWRGRHLYIRNLYIGEVIRVVPKNWREMSIYKPPLPMEESMRKNRESLIRHNEFREARPWRAWVMKTEDGEEHGFFATEDEAKAAVVQFATEQIFGAAQGT